MLANPVRCFTLNASTSGIKVMTGRTSINSVPITEVAAIMYPPKIIAGDAYGSFDNFAFWGRSLHQNDLTPASDAAYKIGYAINPNAQASWTGTELAKNDAKIATLKNEAPSLNAEDIGSGGMWYMQSSTANGSNTGDINKTPEVKFGM